jgi:hypothetical protein
MAFLLYQCSEDIAGRLPAILEAGGFRVSRWEPKPNMHPAKPCLIYIISDGIRSGTLGCEKEDGRVVMFFVLHWSWKLSAHIGKKKFAAAVIACLLHAGVTEFTPDAKAA